MTRENMPRGGETLAVLTRMDPWEADCILNLRLWCEGPDSHAQIQSTFAQALGRERGRRAFDALGQLIATITRHAHRPMVRHDVTCSCVGADECVFCNLVRVASAGELNDAALIATLLAGPGFAEHIAILAAEVGQLHREAAAITTTATQYRPMPAPLRLH